MSAVTPPSQPPSPHAPTDDRVEAEPAVTAGVRGETRIADRVVAKIAAQAAREALRQEPAVSGEAHATVNVHRRDDLPDRLGEARVRVTLDLGYPADLGAQCGAVRRRVVERVAELAAMEVPEIAVSVERLRAPRHREGRVR